MKDTPSVPDGFDWNNPAALDALLKAEFPGETLSDEEEAVGLAGSNPDLFVQELDGEASRISEKLRLASEQIEFKGMPVGFPELFIQVKQSVEELHRKYPDEAVRFCIRRSCSNAQDTLVVYVSKCSQHHWNLAHMFGYKRSQLMGWISANFGYETQLLENNEYGQI